MSKVKLKGVVKYSYKQSGRAIFDYSMIANQDRILLGFSGGKDSVALLKLLLMRRQRIPIDFEIIICVVDFGFLDIKLQKIIDYCHKRGLSCIIRKLELNTNNINCFWCSWNRRKALFEAARDYKCNKVALGHNRDDIIETILMNIFFTGEVSTMRPEISLFKGKIKIIRPLSYLQNSTIENFVKNLKMPLFSGSCPHEDDSKRKKIQALIKDMQNYSPQVKLNIFNSLKKIKRDYLL